MQISRVGVISHPKTEPQKVKGIIEKLESEKISLYPDPYTAEKTNQQSVDVKEMDVDAAVILGGDGTTLWSAVNLKPGTLILPINAGEVGYLSEINIDKAAAGIDRLLKGDFSVEKRMKLKANNKYECLNEVIIYPSDPATLMEFNVSLDNKESINYRSDGILVSTPTGSTAYSFSLGNPVMHPDTKAYIISPICPLIRDQAAVVVPDGIKAEIKLLREDKEANLIIDGISVQKLSEGDITLVEVSENTADFIRFNKNFSYHYVNIHERRK